MNGQTTPRVRLAELNRDQCCGIAEAGGVAVIPIGATEQHGPHLPSCTDTVATDYVSTTAAEALVNRIPIVVCPTLPYGCSSHHLLFGGTASLSPQTMLAVLIDLGDSLVESGFSRIMIVNGHGGNHDIMRTAVSELSRRHDVSLAAASWWQLAEDALIEAGALNRGDLPGHAGAFETSLILSLHPTLVGKPPSRPVADIGVVGLRAPLMVRQPGDWQARDGYTDNPARADADTGASYLETGVAALAAAIERFAREA